MKFVGFLLAVVGLISTIYFTSNTPAFSKMLIWFFHNVENIRQTIWNAKETVYSDNNNEEDTTPSPTPPSNH